MNATDLKRLLSQDEYDRLDFKLECHALNGKDEDNAELAKDLCALANNGNVVSHLVIGVSDDKTGFKSVANSKLTDDNLQRFVRDAISPAVRLRLYRISHNGKNLIVIKVGPNLRSAFYIARDYGMRSARNFHRKHEVWVRLGATSELAHPAQIASFLKGQKIDAEPFMGTNTLYQDKPREKRIGLLLQDLASGLKDFGGTLTTIPEPIPKEYREKMFHRITLPIKGETYVFGLGAHESYDRAWYGQWIQNYHSSRWRFEHGVIAILMGRFPPSAVPSIFDLSISKPWGWMGYKQDPAGLYQNDPISVRVPVGTGRIPLLILAIANAKDTRSLLGSLSQMVHFLEGSQEALAALRESRTTIDSHLARWQKKGWRFDLGESWNYPSSGRRHGDKKDPKSGDILRLYKSPPEAKHAAWILRRSKRR